VRKNVFYILTNVVNKKWGKKPRETFFHKCTNSASKKCWEKIVVKKCEKPFLYSHECRDQKMLVKKRAKQFLQKNAGIVRAKNVWKKSSETSAKKSFL